MPVIRRTPVKDARADVGRMIRRMNILSADAAFIRDLREVAAGDVATSSEHAAWPTDVQELADKIGRQQYVNGLRPTELPVRNADRQIIIKKLPRGIEVQRNDHQYV